MGVFAVRNIKQGEVIFVEASLLPDTGGNTWFRKHASFNIASPAKKNRYNALHSYCNCHRTPCKETPFMKIWDVNSFNVHSLGEPAHTQVFEHASRINHSCLANATYSFTSQKHMVVRAAREIAPREEITFNYVGTIGDTKTRSAQLAAKYGFECACEACGANRSIAVADMLLLAGDAFGTGAVEPPGGEVIGLHSVQEKRDAARVTQWLLLLSHNLEEFRLKLLPVIMKIQKEEILDKGERDVGQINFQMAEDVLSVWMTELMRCNNEFELTEEFLVLSFKMMLSTWEQAARKPPTRDVFMALHLLMDAIHLSVMR